MNPETEVFRCLRIDKGIAREASRTSSVAPKRFILCRLELPPDVFCPSATLRSCTSASCDNLSISHLPANLRLARQGSGESLPKRFEPSRPRLRLASQHVGSAGTVGPLQRAYGSDSSLCQLDNVGRATEVYIYIANRRLIASISESIRCCEGQSLLCCRPNG